MRSPAFSKSVHIGVARLAAANTARDGSGTIAALFTAKGKYAPITVSAGNDTVTIANWATISSEVLGIITNGDRVSLVSGTAPGGLANNTDYLITELVLDTTANTATFKLLDTSTLAIIDIITAGTNPIIMLPNGTRVDGVKFTASQATAAAAATKVFTIFLWERRTAAWRFIAEVAAASVTASTTAIGLTATYTFANGLIMQEGDKLGCAQTVYGSAADQTDAIAFNIGSF